ncbi:endoribonuclease YbeY isoform X2 [Dromiciops gliroides]|uniref:endoribonuclease YbeY isoform X2 n=1 Tax=Dromiciops gliroides TaxID=33562 RepID=UPI001CC3D567|nr:endoribonuclease YbeY isoform X2 [Dromiciops gliroides]
MSLILRNLQSSIPIRRVPLRARIELLRHVLGIQQFDLGVICMDNKGIQRLNRTYRQNQGPTDVLSFPFHEVTAAHGLCHLLGYKHHTAAEWQEMYQKEKLTLEALNKVAGTSLQPLTKNLFG